MCLVKKRWPDNNVGFSCLHHKVKKDVVSEWEGFVQVSTSSRSSRRPSENTHLDRSNILQQTRIDRTTFVHGFLTEYIRSSSRRPSENTHLDRSNILQQTRIDRTTFVHGFFTEYIRKQPALEGFGSSKSTGVRYIERFAALIWRSYKDTKVLTQRGSLIGGVSFWFP